MKAFENKGSVVKRARQMHSIITELPALPICAGTRKIYGQRDLSDWHEDTMCRFSLDRNPLKLEETLD